MDKNKIVWQIEKRKIKDLKKWAKNPRKMLKKPLSNLKESIDKFGLAEPIVIQPNGDVIGGHARIEVMTLSGITECDCYVPDRELTEEEHKELGIRLNKNIAGEWDFDILLDNFDKEWLVDIGFEEFSVDVFEDIILEKEENEKLKKKNKDEIDRFLISIGGSFFTIEDKILCEYIKEFGNKIKKLEQEKLNVIGNRIVKLIQQNEYIILDGEKK